MSAMDYFSREIFDSWSLMPGGSVVPSVGSFRRRDNFLAWRELFNCEPLWAKISHLILRGIQPVWLILLCIKICPIVVKISPKHSRSNDKRKCVGKFWYLKYFLVVFIYVTRLAYFLATPTLMLISRQPIRISKNSDSLWWLVPCE